MTRLLVYSALALSLGVAIAAQSPPEPSFDVVSVKRNNSGGGRMMRNSPGNLSAFNVPVRELIKMAFQIQDFQIIGAPDWKIGSLILQESLTLGLLGYGLGAALITLTADSFPRRVAILPFDQYVLLGIVVAICVLASVLGIRRALGVDPTTAMGGGA